MGGWHALDANMGIFIRKGCEQGETARRAREGEEATGQNLGRPAPRVPRKLGQVFCTCRSNAGTFATVFIAILFLFAIPSIPLPFIYFFFFFFHPYASSCCLRSSSRVLAATPAGNRSINLLKKPIPNNNHSSYLPLSSNWTRCWTQLQFHVFLSIVIRNSCNSWFLNNFPC